MCEVYFYSCSCPSMMMVKEESRGARKLGEGDFQISTAEFNLTGTINLSIVGLEGNMFANQAHSWLANNGRQLMAANIEQKILRWMLQVVVA